MNDAQRIAKQRQRLLDRKNDRPKRWYVSPVIEAESLKSSEGLASRQLRAGFLCRDRLLSAKFAFDDLDILAGRLDCDFKNPEAEMAAANEYLSKIPYIGGQSGHCELDRSKIFASGIDGLRKEIEGLEGVSDQIGKEAYQSFLQALDGLSGMIENAAKTASSAMDGATPERKVELTEIVASCERIAHDAPESFRDAIQLLWFMDMACSMGDQISYTVPGHLDRTLFPFYERDSLAGKIDREEALLLIEALYLLVNDFWADGGAVSVMVGGKDSSGRDSSNELSYLCLEALRRVNLVYPTVGVCWHEDTPQELSELAVELISLGYSTPAFFSDEVIQKGLKLYGVPDSEACDYINSTCVEITPVASSNVWVASPYFSCGKILLQEIAAQASLDFASSDFETFLNAYKSRFAEEIRKAVKNQRELRDLRRQFKRHPLQSVFTKDCLKNGRDIDDGGARYNWVECSFVGIANLADSLHVIREEIFKNRKMDFPELKNILDADFAGFESARQRFMNAHAKYGNDCPEVDALVAETVDFFTSECAKHSLPPDNSAFIPGAFCWVMHERLGSECGATPDGRLAGTPFADGAGPAQGREKAGPTAAILSSTSWDHSPLLGGVAYNMKFNSSLFANEESRKHLLDLILTFLRRGGFETQINVVDYETLKKARENPDDYRDLVVRIGGYTDYFTRLTPEMQNEVMMRTEFSSL